MRRLEAALVALGAALALAGCGGLPAGTDGDLTNDWPAMPEATVSLPLAGVCYDQIATSAVWYGDFPSHSCTTSHQVETVYVGTFTGADAGRSSPPIAGSQARAQTYGLCRAKAADYLGDDWHLAMLRLTLVLPSVEAWTGGARWFRCDVFRFTDARANEVSDAAGSVKDGLRDRPLALTCWTETDYGDNQVSEHTVDCAQPHNVELAGLFTAPDTPWIADDKARQDMAFKGCEGVVARYLGFANGRDTSPYLGYGTSLFDQDQWDLGDRTIRCSAIGFRNNSINGISFTGTVKGLGTRKPANWN